MGSSVGAKEPIIRGRIIYFHDPYRKSKRMYAALLSQTIDTPLLAHVAPNSYSLDSIVI